MNEDPEQEVDAGEIQLDVDEENSGRNPQEELSQSELSTDRSAIFSPEDVVRPTGKQIQKGFKYFDLTIKLEKLLYDLHSYLYWSSLVELCMFALAVLMFFKFIE